MKSYVRMKATRDVSSVSHAGETYEVEDGHIEVPPDHVQHLIPHGFEPVENINLERQAKKSELPEDERKEGEKKEVVLDDLDDQQLVDLFTATFGKAPNKRWDRARILAELRD